MIPSFWLMFVWLGIYIYSLPGAAEGYKYIFMSMLVCDFSNKSLKFW